MKTTIITAIATTVLINTLLYLLSGWMIFLVIWIALGFLAKKTVDLSDNDEGFKYFVCFAIPPVALILAIGDEYEQVKKRLSFIFDKLPKFRNPFVWPEKSE